MMARACRNALSRADVRRASHAGLLLDCYLEEPVKSEGTAHQEARKKLLEAAIHACADSADLYRQAFARWQKSVPGLREQVQVDGRMVLGLGGESPLETGLRLHRTYGTPILPGSALKGVAAHYCDQVWGSQKQEFRRPGRYFQALFGTTEDEGHILFHDAWIRPESLRECLVLDVMTVHHPDYYQGKGKAPSDYDSPTPIAFLSIRGSFEIVLSCDVGGEEGEKWTRLGLELLRQALGEWGIGGKTRAGYGRMQRASAGSGTGGAAGPAAPTAQPEDFRTGQTVRCVVLEEKTKKGKWSFEIEGTGLTGVLHPQSAEPPDLQPGEVLSMEIRATGRTFQFHWKEK